MEDINMKCCLCKNKTERLDDRVFVDDQLKQDYKYITGVDFNATESQTAACITCATNIVSASRTKRHLITEREREELEKELEEIETSRKHILDKLEQLKIDTREENAIKRAPASERFGEEDANSKKIKIVDLTTDEQEFIFPCFHCSHYFHSRWERRDHIKLKHMLPFLVCVADGCDVQLRGTKYKLPHHLLTSHIAQHHIDLSHKETQQLFYKAKTAKILYVNPDLKQDDNEHVTPSSCH